MTAIVLAALSTASIAEAECRQALAFGLDVSGSVDSREYRLQIQGLSNALLHPDVTSAMLAMPSAPVELAVFEWSDAAYQNVLVGWTTIAQASDLSSFRQELVTTSRSSAPPATGLGEAIRFGADLLSQRKECWKRTLDISGDGRNNSGPTPDVARASLGRHGITINGLVIGSDDAAVGDRRQMQIGELSSYYRAYVIEGPDSFVEAAIGFEDYEAAMVRKLLRELQGLVLSDIGNLKK